MKKRSKIPQVRQHIRDKAIIDHLTSGPLKPNMAPEGQKNRHQFTERDGRTLDKAIHEKWTSDKGGLPDFLNDPPKKKGPSKSP
jgi:hypothetical protein